jgi:hypothetical protein
MPRVSEFEWRVPRQSRRKHWLTALVVGAGLGTGYLFVQSGREVHNDSLPLTAAVDPQVSRPLQVEVQGPAHHEKSEVASVARPRDPSLAHSEPSAIASAPVRIEIINAPPPQSAAQPDPSSASVSERDRLAAAPNYASLRRELLRHLR